VHAIDPRPRPALLAALVALVVLALVMFAMALPTSLDDGSLSLGGASGAAAGWAETAGDVPPQTTPSRTSEPLMLVDPPPSPLDRR